MLKFITFAVRVKLNVHDLNNETTAGNVMDIRQMSFLDQDNNIVEAPAVSGRMLKHWHYEGMRRYLRDNNNLCDACKVGEPIRPGRFKDNNLMQVAIEEEEAIKCPICDVHGYLIAQEAEGEGRGTSSRRASRVMFSWLMPVLGYEFTSKQVIHNKVSSDPEEMMPFSKSYASAIYSFVSALDIERIGLVETRLGGNNPYVIEENDRKSRIKAAIEAFRLLISGQMGASLSHAVPHMELKSILVAYSENHPLPFPVSPMYPDYLEKTVGLIPESTPLLYWSDSDEQIPEGITKKNSPNEIFKELLDKVG